MLYSSAGAPCQLISSVARVFSDLCSSVQVVGGVVPSTYATALTTCATAGALDPLIATLYFTSVQTPFLDCTDIRVVSTLSSPGVGVCTNTTGSSTLRFLNNIGSFAFLPDTGGPPSCSTTADSGAVNVAVSTTGACPLPTPAGPSIRYATMPTVAAAGGCSVLGLANAFQTRATVSGGTGAPSLSLALYSSADCATGQVSSWPALPLNGSCATGSNAATAAAAYATAPFPPPPRPAAPPGSGAYLEVFSDAAGAGCAGAPISSMPVFTDYCAAFGTLGVALIACAPGASATIRVFSGATPPTPGTQQPPPRCDGPSFDLASAVGACQAFPSAPGLSIRLVSAACAPTPAGTLFSRAIFNNTMSCIPPPAPDFQPWYALSTAAPCLYDSQREAWGAYTAGVASGEVTVRYYPAAAAQCIGAPSNTFESVRRGTCVGTGGVSVQIAPAAPFALPTSPTASPSGTSSATDSPLPTATLTPTMGSGSGSPSPTTTAQNGAASTAAGGGFPGGVAAAGGLASALLVLMGGAAAFVVLRWRAGRPVCGRSEGASAAAASGAKQAQMRATGVSGHPVFEKGVVTLNPLA